MSVRSESDPRIEPTAGTAWAVRSEAKADRVAEDRQADIPGIDRPLVRPSKRRRARIGYLTLLDWCQSPNSARSTK